MVPQAATAPIGPAVKNPITAAIPCSNPVTVFLTRTLFELSIGSSTTIGFIGFLSCFL